MSTQAGNLQDIFFGQRIKWASSDKGGCELTGFARINPVSRFSVALTTPCNNDPECYRSCCWSCWLRHSPRARASPGRLMVSLVTRSQLLILYLCTATILCKYLSLTMGSRPLLISTMGCINVVQTLMSNNSCSAIVHNNAVCKWILNMLR